MTAALAAASSGSVIELTGGTFNETFTVATDNVTIRSAAGTRAVIDCSGMRPSQDKACIVASGSRFTIEGVTVRGAKGSEGNEACFRNEPGTDMVLRRIECSGSYNGILGSGGSWLIEDSTFRGNGAGDGFTHNLYFSGDCSEVVFRRSRSEGSIGGHAFKSRCRRSVIEGSVLVDNAVADAAEFSYGGDVVIRSSTLRQPDGGNGNIVRHGAEGCRHGGTLTLDNVTIENARSQGYITSDCGPVVVSNSTIPASVTIRPN